MGSADSAQLNTFIKFWINLSLRQRSDAAFVSIILICMLLYLDSTYRLNSLSVGASAYNSVKSQTDNEPLVTAAGHKLKVGQKIIAVSRDLLERGLEFGTLVKIEGLAGDYIVEDVMAANYKMHIDIYMDKDIQAAREWGRRDVTIHW